MKKIKYAFVAVLVVAALALNVGCADKPEEEVTVTPDTNVPSATEVVAAVTTFKTGTWASTEGVNYVFYEDGKGGRNVNVADGMGVGFEYELSEDGTCVFHMGGADDNTPATVEFLEGGDDTAAITWADGSKIVLYFVKDDTSDEFADTYVMGEVTADDDVEAEAVTAFKTGTWACAEGVNYVFYEDGKSGRNVTVADGMGTAFEYELAEDGSCVFHMGSVDDNTPATVEFIEGGDDTAAITWADGSKIVLYFVKDDTSDEFADTYVMGEVTASEE